MRFRFANLELDVGRRELARAGRPLELQPQVFDLLCYLVAHRDRVVSKDELFAALWPDANVSDGSLQGAVSLLRTALGGTPTPIRTYARRGYRFVGPVEALDSARGAEVEYVRAGDVHLAYRTVGEGAIDLVVVPGWTFPMSAWTELPRGAEVLAHLAQLGRVVLFDWRGVGLSDRCSGRCRMRAARMRARWSSAVARARRTHSSRSTPTEPSVA